MSLDTREIFITDNEFSMVSVQLVVDSYPGLQRKPERKRCCSGILELLFIYEEMSPIGGFST